jgi:glucose-1-phosphate cytidylyltransferase
VTHVTATPEPRTSLPVDLPVVILCGGKGTRLGAGQSLPKPLVEVGGRPIVQHVVELYAAQGRRRFLLAAGHRADLLAAAVASISWPDGVTVEAIDTGIDTETGGRIRRLRERLAGETFHVTYADGLADIDLDRLQDRHVAAGRTATITVVRPELPFGVVDVADDGGVVGFREKPRSRDWINGGFMLLEPDVFDVLEDDHALEREPFERLAAAQRLQSAPHEGFWACMDTYKDARRLNELWDAGVAPWATATNEVRR